MTHTFKDNAEGVPAIPNPLDGILTVIRREAAAAAVEAIQRELLREKHAQSSGPRLLSFDSLNRRYGVGRIVVKRLMAEGRLPFVERPCRGGYIGTFVTIEDSERIFAGRKA